MASPCELIIETDDNNEANIIGKMVANEVWRIEDKYSRYNRNSECYKINNSNGESVPIDNETYLLLNFAQTCFELSGGLFDITSGVLRRAWIFDGSDNIPLQQQISPLLNLVGWNKVRYTDKEITLAANMEIDFGGIGKEYAVDKALAVVKSNTNKPTLINLGGDLAATSSRKNNEPWQIGIEHPGFVDSKKMVVSLSKGALATSGDAKRFLLKNNIRYSHIVNAHTGWPIEHAPKSITVTAPKCIQAGILATLALLQGVNAEKFLQEQSIKFWAIR